MLRWVFLFLLLAGECLRIRGTEQSQSPPLSSKPRPHKPQRLNTAMLFLEGNAQLVPGITVYGAVIVSDQFHSFSLDNNNVTHTQTHTQNTTSDSNTHSETKADSPEQQKIVARIKNVHLLQSQVPFNLTRWSAVTTGPCPHYPSLQSTERGLVWAHYRIWRDFVSFDEELVAKAETLKDKGFVSLSSQNGMYTLFANGTRVKRNQVMREEDVLIIFEDDATSAVSDTHAVLAEELRGLNVDMLFLGWCEGRTARPVPLCAHAYAITRKAARKLVHYLEPCGRAVDEQFVILAKNGWLSYRRAHPWSYQTLRPDFNPHGDKTKGIFRQCKSECGSTNGNR